MIISREQIDAIVEYLDDTNETIAEAVEAVVGDFQDESNLSDQQREEIASRIFSCSNCGYWFPHEVGNENVGGEGQKCDDCVSTGMDDDDDY